MNIGSTAELTNGISFQLFSAAGSREFQLDPVIHRVPAGLNGPTNWLWMAASPWWPLPPPAPTNITYSVSGGNLTLNWPAGQGWQLQARTNSLTVGPWDPVPGAVPPLLIPVNPANGEVYYRLVCP